MDARQVRFEQLYDDNYRALLGYALRRVVEPGDAADVVAEAFLAAWRRLDDVPEGPEARLWLYGVARNVLLNQRRGERRRSALADRLRRELTEQTVQPADDADGSQVRAAYARLSEADREVLALVGWEELDRDAVATVLGCSRALVRVRLHRARSRFAAELSRPPARPAPARPQALEEL